MHSSAPAFENNWLPLHFPKIEAAHNLSSLLLVDTAQAKNGVHLPFEEKNYASNTNRTAFYSYLQ